MCDPPFVKIFFPAADGRGLTRPAAPLARATRAAGRAVVSALTAVVAGTAADSGPSSLDAVPAGDLGAALLFGGGGRPLADGGSGPTAAALHRGVSERLRSEAADPPLVAAQVVGRKAELPLALATRDTATFHQAGQRLLREPAFAEAAGTVARQRAARPSPVAVLDRQATDDTASR
ncbi:nucleotide disphospho-sugar-binding domain-containing protein [Micromonospora sp. NPDC005252]|uniref:nucleotide disphospho-sugar-binding domain-containing protein n=1 Tax=unclassified Micromonospora TaxID=2617518 RepID=UPI0036CB7483